jgi:hypothetical protein
MTVARLVATVPSPLRTSSADAPEVTHRGGRRLLVQRGDDELVLRDPDAEGPRAEVRFPAPWPRRFGEVAVSPEGGLAVFAGVHALRAVEASGATRWEVRHGCWGGACSSAHETFAEYADDEEHRYPDSGSAAFSSDGKLVWAHMRGPLTADGGSGEDQELWLVLDAADGRVLGRVQTMTVGSVSYHTPHPDPARMGLSVGEGEEGSPVLWGHWDGARLSARKVDDELLLQDVSPSGRSLLAVDIGQHTLYLQSAGDGSVLRELDAEGAVPVRPGSTVGERVYWDYEAAFVDEDTVVAGTSECDAGLGTARHWLVDARTMTLRGEISYPFPVSGPARPAGDGSWYTVPQDGESVSVWELPASL